MYALALAAVDPAPQDESERIGFIWVYILSPLVGGALAGLWQKVNQYAEADAEKAKQDAGDMHGGINYQDQGNGMYADL